VRAFAYLLPLARQHQQSQSLPKLMPQRQPEHEQQGPLEEPGTRGSLDRASLTASTGHGGLSSPSRFVHMRACEIRMTTNILV
jgi:hypothetical protein